MDAISPEIALEIERRVASGAYVSANELLRDALNALDRARENSDASLERELLAGLEGDDVEMTAADWDDIERQAIEALESKKAQ